MREDGEAEGGAAADFTAGLGSDAATAGVRLSCFSTTAGAVATTGPTTGGAGDGFVAGGSTDAVAAAAAETAGVGAAAVEGGAAGSLAEALAGVVTLVLP